MPISRLAFPLLALALAPGAACAGTTPSPGCRVDRAQFDALRSGMSERRVRTLLGCHGRRVSHLTVGKSHRATYSWPGHGTYGANLTLTFQDGHLTDKAQLGLR
jgi:hypothetical protein